MAKSVAKSVPEAVVPEAVAENRPFLLLCFCMLLKLLCHLSTHSLSLVVIYYVYDISAQRVRRMPGFGLVCINAAWLDQNSLKARICKVIMKWSVKFWIGGMKMEIAFIGLGTMGRHMAVNLLKAGYKLTVFNRDRRKTEGLGLPSSLPIPPEKRPKRRSWSLPCFPTTVL